MYKIGKGVIIFCYGLSYFVTRGYISYQYQNDPEKDVDRWILENETDCQDVFEWI